MTRKRDHLNKLQNYLFSYLRLLFWFNRWGRRFSRGRSHTAIRQISVMKKLRFNPLTTNVPHHIETSQLICSVNQFNGFYMMGKTGRYWVKIYFEQLNAPTNDYLD